MFRENCSSTCENLHEKHRYLYEHYMAQSGICMSRAIRVKYNTRALRPYHHSHGILVHMCTCASIFADVYLCFIIMCFNAHFYVSPGLNDGCAVMAVLRNEVYTLFCVHFAVIWKADACATVSLGTTVTACPRTFFMQLVGQAHTLWRTKDRAGIELYTSCFKHIPHFYIDTKKRWIAGIKNFV